MPDLTAVLDITDFNYRASKSIYYSSGEGRFPPI